MTWIAVGLAIVLAAFAVGVIAYIAWTISRTASIARTAAQSARRVWEHSEE